VPIASAQRKVAYFTQWGIRVHNYAVKDVDISGAASKLTAINYAFAGISSDLKCQSADPKADYQEPFTDTVSGQADRNDPKLLAGNFNQLKELKAKYKNLKILISIGGWTLSGQFSNAAKPQNVQSFVKSCIDMFIKGNILGLAPGAAAGIFDGIDIDWEYPAFQRTDGQSKGEYTFSRNDTQNYTVMLAEFRRQLGNKYLLSIAAPAGQDKFSNIQLNKIGQYVNWINLMTFNYQGSWGTQTDIQPPLYCDPKGSLSIKTYCIDYSVTSYREAGVPAAKINLGLSFSGHASTNSTKNQQGLYQKDVKPTPGQYNAGSNGDKKQLKSQGYAGRRGDTAKGDGNFNSAASQSFDNAQEIIDKVNYARSRGLGGVFCWSLDDDPQGALLKVMAQ